MDPYQDLSAWNLGGPPSGRSPYPPTGVQPGAYPGESLPYPGGGGYFPDPGSGFPPCPAVYPEPVMFPAHNYPSSYGTYANEFPPPSTATSGISATSGYDYRPAGGPNPAASGYPMCPPNTSGMGSGMGIGIELKPPSDVFGHVSSPSWQPPAAFNSSRTEFHPLGEQVMAGAFGGTSTYSHCSDDVDVFAPTLKPYLNFDPVHDCERLRKAMKGAGTDEKTIIDIMGHRSWEQRTKIVLQFKTMYGKDLLKEFRSELSGHFYECVEALCYSPTDLDAMQLRKAMKGAGTDESALIEILCSRSNEQIKRIKEAFARMYPGRNLEKDVASETSGHFRRMLISLLQANRDESKTVDQAVARRDAEELYRAGEKRLGTDESTFNKILASRSFPHLRAVFDEYSKVSRKDIEQALKSEMSADLLRSMLAVVRCIRNKPKYFAYALKNAMKGAGTRDRALIRLVVSRCEIDMAKIKEEFQKENGKSLESWITGDTSGDYRKLLLALVT
ncbi:Annexin A11 [Clonorchis sinensis]|uniref:Annexin n=2 Tax=Clonorchis sinensis TaxID=79923 RepID=A0A3R7H474_CLOSI|nr:Annexin A11 [Clonorchis sinensis]